MTTDTNNIPTNKDASHDDGVTDTNNIVTSDSDAPVCMTFDPKIYAGYMRSASANRASTFATLYANALNCLTFVDHAEQLALAFSTSTGVDTVTLGLVAIVSKLPMAAYEGLEAKARLNVQVKPSLKLEDEFAKLLVPFLTALATVSKYCTVS